MTATDPEIPDSDELPEDETVADKVKEFFHLGEPHPHRHTEGFPQHAHGDADNEAPEGHDSDSNDANVRADLAAEQAAEN